MCLSPSIIPDDADRDIYLVLDDFGQLGRAWRETDERAAEAKAASQARPSFGKFNCSAQPIFCGSVGSCRTGSIC